MFDRPRRPTPKNPISSAIGKSVFMFIMAILALFARQYFASILLIVVGIFWVWYSKRLKKRFEEALRKKEEHLVKLYGYENENEDSDSEEHEYF